MRELALHLLDIAENSVAAGADNITLEVIEDFTSDRLAMRVVDDGKGMDAETAAHCLDPFYTSRTTRKVGLGIPLLKAAAEACDGGLTLHSEVGRGTTLKVDFRLSHIDRMPLGSLADTCLNLVVAYPHVNWRIFFQAGGYRFEYDQAEVMELLDGVSMSEPSVLHFLRNYFEEGISSHQELQPSLIAN